MKSILFEAAGQPHRVLHYADSPLPEMRQHEVLVKVIASPIHPSDLMFIQGRYRKQPIFPQIAGLEGAGTVVKAGKETTVTEDSLVAVRSGGCWAEYVVVPAEDLYVLPRTFPHEKACQFALNPVTAWALLHESRVAENDYLLLTAGNSAVAKILVQLTKARRIKAVAAVRGLKDKEELLALGAAAVVNVLEEGWTDEVMQLTGNKGVPAALDAVGGRTGTELLNCMAAGGVVVVYGLLSPDNVQLHNASIIMKLLTIKGFGLDNWLGRVPDVLKQQMVDQLVSILAAPSFRMDVAGKYNLRDFQEAFEATAPGPLTGKILFWNG